VSDGIAGGQVVGIDLHLYRSMIGRVRIENDPKALVAECRKAGRGAPVAIEATHIWVGAVDALLAAGDPGIVRIRRGAPTPRNNRLAVFRYPSHPTSLVRSRLVVRRGHLRQP
jgi:hypothetical protein